MDSRSVELAITAQKVAETLDIGRSTLNKYSRSLEDAGYIFIKDERGNRAYMERDIVAIRYAIMLLSRGVLYEKAMADAALKHTRITDDGFMTGYTESGVITAFSEKSDDGERFIANLKQELSSELLNIAKGITIALRQENEELRSILQETLFRLDDMSKQNRQLTEMVSMQQQLAAALPSPFEQRADQLNGRLTERRVERQLEREALDKWNAKPEAERQKKAGLFRKEEDAAARERFIKEYVDQHYEERIRKQLEK